MFSFENITIRLDVWKKMPEEFPLNTGEEPTDAALNRRSHSKRRSNQMILIGAPTWVRKIIHLMHIARIAEVKDWSRLTPTQNRNEVISLMQRPRVEE